MASGFTAYDCQDVAIPSLFGQAGYHVANIRMDSMMAAASRGFAMSGGHRCIQDQVCFRWLESFVMAGLFDDYKFHKNQVCNYTLTNSAIVATGAGRGFYLNQFSPTEYIFPRSTPISFAATQFDAGWGGSVTLSGVSFHGAGIVTGLDPDTTPALYASRLSGASVRIEDPNPSWVQTADGPRYANLLSILAHHDVFQLI